MKPIDYSVYLVTDAPEKYSGRMTDAVDAALAGGVTVVQYRATSGSRQQQYETAVALRRLTRSRGVPLIVNDQVDLAQAIDADGVHVGQHDLPAEVVRRLMGHGKILGLSITTADQLAGVSWAVDYVGIGPVFATATKPDAAPALGVAELAAIVRRAEVPTVAIGGINLENTPVVFATGVDGVAVVSAFSSAADPAAVARGLRRAKTDRSRSDSGAK